MSKGSKQRPTDKKKFDQNYDNIDWTSWREPGAAIEKAKLSKEQMKQLLDIVKNVRNQSQNEEMDINQD